MLDRDGNNGYEPNNNDDGYEAFVDADIHVEVGFHGNQALHDDNFREETDFGFEGEIEDGDYV